MKKNTSKRVVVVHRPSAFEELLARHGTQQQSEFFLQSRGQSLAEVMRGHEALHGALQTASQGIPKGRRRSNVLRNDLNRFLFEPQDIIVVVGPDGLVANVAKYIDSQMVIGVNPDPAHVDGVLVRHRASDVKNLLEEIEKGRLATVKRTMVEVCTDNGDRLVALNEIFVGHKTHQSARYEIQAGGNREMQSSSGLIVSTGTGATGWARSISQQRAGAPKLPNPYEERLVFFVRECFPSISTGTNIQMGEVEGKEQLLLRSHMNSGGVIFGDGIEDDRVEFHWGMNAEIQLSKRCLHLV